jgi:hypothetical protein
MLNDLHLRENKVAWDALNETRISSGLEPHRRPLARYEVIGLVVLLISIVAMTLLST